MPVSTRRGTHPNSENAANSRVDGQRKKPVRNIRREGPLPGLLDPTHPRRLRIGVDFGTSNSSAAFVVVDGPDDKILQHVTRITALHVGRELIRFPTLVAVRPLKGNSNKAELVFAQEALNSLHRGHLAVDNMIPWPKLGLIDDFSGIFETDKTALEHLREIHGNAIKTASTTSIRIKYPDGTEEKNVSLTTIDAVIVRTLRYFRALVKVNLVRKLELSAEQVEWLLKNKTEVGFAAPTFWKDKMLDKFLRLIQSAGWPAHCKIWSEPKCALSAHVALSIAHLSNAQRQDLQDSGSSAAQAVINIGGGSLDGTTIRTSEFRDDCIKFETIAESSGSLCGGRLLDYNLEAKLREILRGKLDDVIPKGPDGRCIEKVEFFQSFAYAETREDFDGKDDEYWIRYGGSDLPAKKYQFMTPKAVKISKKKVIAAHDAYLERILKHIDDQLTKTRQAIAGQEQDIELVLLGGVTRSPYIVQKIRGHLSSQEDVNVLDVENAHHPLVAIGCILALGQPAIGRRFASKEAYGTPVAKKFDSREHDLRNQWNDERSDMGQEARDLADWIIKVGDRAIPKTSVYEHTVAFLEKDEKTPRKTSPMDDNSVYPVVIQQSILNTDDPTIGQSDTVQHTTCSDIYVRDTLELKLSKDKCMTIHQSAETAGHKLGFWQDPQNGNWFFTCTIKVKLEWHDVRLTWRALIPKAGVFVNGVANEVWSEEVQFATNNNHGVKDGDKSEQNAMDLSD